MLDLNNPFNMGGKKCQVWECDEEAMPDGILCQSHEIQSQEDIAHDLANDEMKYEEEVPNITDQMNRCDRGACLLEDCIFTKDGEPCRCRFCGKQAPPCTHPKGQWCTTCRKV